MAGYLQSSRYQQAFIDRAEPPGQQVAVLRDVAGKRGRVATQLVRAVLASPLERLAQTMTAGQQADASGPWPKYLHDVALAKPRDVFHPWAVLTADASADAFAQRSAPLRFAAAGRAG